MGKRKRGAIVFRTLILSTILSLFGISFMQKNYDPAKAFLNDRNLSSGTLKIYIDENFDEYELPFGSSIPEPSFIGISQLKTYKYIQELTNDNFIPYNFAESNRAYDRRLIKIGEEESINLSVGNLPYTRVSVNNKYCFPGILLYEGQVDSYIDKGYSYEDLLLQELQLIPYNYHVIVGFCDSGSNDYKISGFIKGDEPEGKTFEVVSYLFSDQNKYNDVNNFEDDIITYMDGFTYTLTGNYEQDYKVVNLLFGGSELENVSFSLDSKNAPKKNKQYNQLLELQDKYQNNTIYIYGIILGVAYLVFSLQNQILKVIKLKKDNIISKETKLIKVLKESYVNTLVYLIGSLIISTIVCLILYLFSKTSLIYFSINPFVSYLIPIGIWIVYAPINVIIYNEVVS